LTQQPLESSRIETAQLGSGLTVVAEPMPWLRSAAFTLLLPAGTCYEPADRGGLAGLTLELMQRGAGPLSSRDIVARLDELGVERAAATSTLYSTFSAAMLSEQLIPTLQIYSDILQRPHLPGDELDEARDGALQELRAIQDDPGQCCLLALKRLRLGPVFGRSGLGDESGLRGCKLEDVTQFWQNQIRPGGAVLGVAGQFDWSDLIGALEELFGSWHGETPPSPGEVQNAAGVLHVPHEGQQTHLCIAFDGLPYGHPLYYRMRGLVGVLSDGMSSRLFTEVREKRGLVYSVSANCQTVGDVGSIICYAGTTAGRTQETLDCILQTIASLDCGVRPEELARLKAWVKSGLVMEQESSLARSSRIANDWCLLGRVNDRRQVLAEVDGLTEEILLEHHRLYPPSNFSIVSLGPEAIEFPHAAV